MSTMVSHDELLHMATCPISVQFLSVHDGVRTLRLSMGSTNYPSGICHAAEQKRCVSPPCTKGPANVEGDGRGRSTYASDLQLSFLRAVEIVHRGKGQCQVRHLRFLGFEMLPLLRMYFGSRAEHHFCLGSTGAHFVFACCALNTSLRLWLGLVAYCCLISQRD